MQNGRENIEFGVADSANLITASERTSDGEEVADDDTATSSRHVRDYEAPQDGGLVGWYSRQLVKLPVAIGMCVSLLILTAVCGVISFVVYDPPDFNSPTKGFEARGTVLSARMVSFFNLLYHTESLSSFYVLNGPASEGTSQYSAANERRRRTDTQLSRHSRWSEKASIQFYAVNLDDFNQAAIVFQAVGNNKLFSRQALISICTQYDYHIGNSPVMHSSCYNINQTCYDSWSLGNYVALMNSRESCQDIQDEDVANVKSILERCAPYYQRKDLRYCFEDNTTCPRDVPLECVSYDHAVYFIYHFLVPRTFTSKANSGNFDLESTMLFLPIHGRYDYTIYKATLEGNDIDNGITRVVALGFGSLKLNLFSDVLLSDTLYIGIGAALVVIIIWVYTGSLFITLMTVISMLMSLVVAYFAYAVIFNLPFFPFVNIVCAVLIIGVGADDTFVYCDIWCQTRSANPGAHRSRILHETLRHASVTMFVTSFTTASALYTNIIGSITAIRCFAVYGGTAIMVNFIFTLTWLPAIVLIHSRFQDWCSTLSNPCQGCTRQLGKVYSFFTAAYHGFFKLLPKLVIKLRFVWIVILASLGAGGICVVFITPKLQLPDQAEFQVFRDNDLFELYDKVYKPKFDFNLDNNNPLYIAVVFGVSALDNGDYWDPDDHGVLSLEPGFNISSPDSQRWLLDFCHSFRNQSFHEPVTHETSYPCFMEYFKGLMETPCTGGNGSSSFSPCCGQTNFPYPPDLFQICLAESRHCDLAKYPYTCSSEITPGPIFNTLDGSVRAFFMQDLSSMKDTFDYEDIDEFWSATNSWIEEKLKTKPEGLTGGWLIAGSISNEGKQLYFYDLQNSLAVSTSLSMGLSLAIAAVVMLLTTWNLLISLYAMLSIGCAFCVTVGSLVLLGWRLNIFESAIFSIAVGLSVDFTIHYGVAYRLAPCSKRGERTLHAMTTVGSAVTVAALSTFVAGAAMMPATVVSYVQLGIFLMLVMSVSWVYATFFFLSVCRVIGPQGNCATIPCPSCRCCGKVRNRSYDAMQEQGSGNRPMSPIDDAWVPDADKNVMMTSVNLQHETGNGYSP